MMNIRELVSLYWQTANARDWVGFAATIHPDIEYRVPQTRELIRGREHFVTFYATYPGDWTLDLTEVLVDGDRVVSTTVFHVKQTSQSSITFFTLKDGLVWRIDDWWPEDYTPPARLVPVARY